MMVLPSIDIDLEANYKLDEIQVYTPSAGYSQYSVYTSITVIN